jgi:hypothetical protein
MKDWFDPLDFSGIPRYPNWENHISKFHRHNDLVALHVTSFVETFQDSMFYMRMSG